MKNNLKEIDKEILTIMCEAFSNFTDEDKERTKAFFKGVDFAINLPSVAINIADIRAKQQEEKKESIKAG